MTKKRIIEFPFSKESSSKKLYHSKYFPIKYYAYLPFIFSLKYAELDKNSRILDLGCAEGPFLPTLNYYYERIISTDINSNSVRKANKLTKNRIVQNHKNSFLSSDILELPFKNNSFHLIFCLEVLEHVKSPYQAIKEINRVLEKNGQLICSVPIELGGALLLRTILAKFTNFNRASYSKKELIRNVILKKPGKRTENMSHKNFDWRKIRKFLTKVFYSTETYFAPIPFIRGFNPIVLFKSIKK